MIGSGNSPARSDPSMAPSTAVSGFCDTSDAANEKQPQVQALEWIILVMFMPLAVESTSQA
jgi:hypothetical protein